VLRRRQENRRTRLAPRPETRGARARTNRQKHSRVGARIGRRHLTHHSSNQRNTLAQPLKAPRGGQSGWSAYELRRERGDRLPRGSERAIPLVARKKGVVSSRACCPREGGERSRRCLTGGLPARKKGRTRRRWRQRERVGSLSSTHGAKRRKSAARISRKGERRRSCPRSFFRQHE